MTYLNHHHLEVMTCHYNHSSVCFILENSDKTIIWIMSPHSIFCLSSVCFLYNIICHLHLSSLLCLLFSSSSMLCKALTTFSLLTLLVGTEVVFTTNSQHTSLYCLLSNKSDVWTVYTFFIVNNIEKCSIIITTFVTMFYA